MSYRLAIDIGFERVQAAVVEDGNVSWVDLVGDGGLLSAVHHGDDGTVVVGDEALAAAGRPGHLDPDPAGSLGADDRSVAGMAALLAAAVESVERQRGEPPELVMLAHPDDWPAAKTRALSDAARRGGLSSFERVSAGAAEDAYRKVSGEADRSPRAIGYGAAVLAAGAVALDATQATAVADGAATLITLEDLAGPLPDTTPPAPPTYQSEGPTSVFDEPASPAAPATQALPVVPPPPPPSGPPPTEPPPEDGNRWMGWAVGLGVFALVLLLALIVVLLNDDSGDEVSTDGSTTTSTDSTTSLTTTTSVPATSSTSTTSSTTTTSTTTTSTTTSTTTTSTTTTSTTTTIAPEPEVVVDPGELVVDGTVVPVGSDGDDAIAAVTSALGPPDSDTGYQPREQCDTDEVRGVAWEGLELVLLDDADQSFAQWVVSDFTGDPGPYRTGADIGVGSSVAELQAAYDDVDLTPAGGGLTEWLFVVTEPGGTIVGITTGGNADDTVLQMWSGDGCSRTFAL